MLPKRVLTRITQVCKAFLWEEKIVLTKAPHVACYWVCKHYKNGGIGVQDCMIWNKRIAGKFVWHFAQKHDLLWIKGIHSVYLREEDW